MGKVKLAGELQYLPWRICNNSEDICELMFIEEPYTGAIWISEDDIFACCRKKDETGHARHFEVGTNIKEIESWIKEKLELI